MSTRYQIQPIECLEDGTQIPLYPINDALDVQVGKLSAGSLTLPGSASDEILAQTLANIKKYLSNLSTVAAQNRGVSNSTTSTSEIDLATSKAVNVLKVRIDGNDALLAEHSTQIAGKAPINHAVEALTYGGATGAKYGHVKLSDVYSTGVANASAQYSVGASQNALFNAYNALDTAKAPNNHAVAATTYGVGSASLYGHVKLSDTYTSKVSNGAAANGLAASQNALYNAYNALKTVNDSQTTAINGKAPTSHASTALTYGAGTSTNYGHVRLSDAYDTDNSSTGAAANSIAASSWALYRAYSALSTVLSTKLPSTHANEKATASKFSHVKLTDTYTSSSGAASAGVGASSLALYNAYAALTSALTTAQNNIATLNSNYDAIKKSVADGKKALAASISTYVTTASDASFDTLNKNMVSAFTSRYNSGYSAGRTQGRSDVKSSPNTYGLYSSSQYTSYGTAQYNSGYKSGYDDGYEIGTVDGAKGLVSLSVTKYNEDRCSAGDVLRNTFRLSVTKGTYILAVVTSSNKNGALPSTPSSFISGFSSTSHIGQTNIQIDGYAYSCVNQILDIYLVTSTDSRTVQITVSASGFTDYNVSTAFYQIVRISGDVLT